MSDKIKLIIEIPKPMYESVQNGTYCGTLYKELKNGIPLDSLKSKIETDLSWEMFDEYGNGTRLHKSLMDILDNIGKAESEVNK